jgi:SsrA-binding protein
MSIAENRRAHFDYHIEDRFEAGVVLQGWEIKSIRSGQVQLTDGYVLIRNGELFLIGCRISPLRTVNTHAVPEAERTRKLLMHKAEIRRLIGKVERRGFTIVPLNLHFKDGRVKVDIALAKGKAQYDKRESAKNKDWEREKGQSQTKTANSQQKSLSVS